MPIVEVEGQQFEFPEGTSDEVIGEAIRKHFAEAEQQPAETPAEQPGQELQEGTALDRFIEPALAVGGGLLGEVTGGLVGLASSPFVGAEGATDAIEGAREFFGVPPKTKKGKEALETLGDVIEAGLDVVRFPISGLAGLTELLSGQGPEQAAKTVKSINERGIGPTAGDRVFEITGDPLLSTLAHTSPEIAVSAIPGAQMAKSHRAMKTKLADKVKAQSAQPELSNVMKETTKVIKEADEGVDPQAIQNAMRQIENEIRVKQGNAVADRFNKHANELQTGDTTAIRSIDRLADEIAAGAPQKSLAKYTVSGAGKLKADPLAKEAIKQGYDQGVIAAIKGSTRLDRSKMKEMVDIMKKGQEDALFAVKNRPSDIAGNSLMERVRYVKDINRQASKQLDEVAQGLRGQTADFSNPLGGFFDELDAMGIRLDKRLRPNFKGSDVEGLKAPQTAIAGITKRLSRLQKGEQIDAFEMHRLKKFIDETVTYGKQGEGLAGKTELLLKKLRRNIDQSLDDAFPKYNEVNTQYADTVGALDDLQDVAGRKLDLFGPNADKATGTLLRRLMSNVQSRINLVDAVDNLNHTAMKYGANFGDDITTQMLFADELDTVFGPVARTSLAGETAKGFTKAIQGATGERTAFGMALEKAGEGVEKLRGINRENAMKVITEILERE